MAEHRTITELRERLEKAEEDLEIAFAVLAQAVASPDVVGEWSDPGRRGTSWRPSQRSYEPVPTEAERREQAAIAAAGHEHAESLAALDAAGWAVAHEPFADGGGQLVAVKDDERVVVDDSTPRPAFTLRARVDEAERKVA